MSATPAAVEFADALRMADAIRAAGVYVEAASVAAAADYSAAVVRRYMERRGINPDTDDDYQFMLASPVTHYYHGNGVTTSPPSSWPDRYPERFAPAEDVVGNIGKALAILGPFATPRPDRGEQR